MRAKESNTRKVNHQFGGAGTKPVERRRRRRRPKKAARCKQTPAPFARLLSARARLPPLVRTGRSLARSLSANTNENTIKITPASTNWRPGSRERESESLLGESFHFCAATLREQNQQEQVPAARHKKPSSLSAGLSVSSSCNFLRRLLEEQERRASVSQISSFAGGSSAPISAQIAASLFLPHPRGAACLLLSCNQQLTSSMSGRRGSELARAQLNLLCSAFAALKAARRPRAIHANERKLRVFALPQPASQPAKWATQLEWAAGCALLLGALALALTQATRSLNKVSIRLCFAWRRGVRSLALKFPFRSFSLSFFSFSLSLSS